MIQKETVDEYIDRVQQHVKDQIECENGLKKEFDRDIYIILVLGVLTFIAIVWWGFI